MSRTSAFTLLEVMVAIAILAVSLSAVFSAEAGSVRLSARARRTGVAALLVRCKMGEIEEQIAEEGLPALFDSGSDACCEDAEVPGFSCKWEIEPVVLPDTMFPDAEAEAEGAGGGAQDPAAGLPADLLAGDPTAMLSGGGDGDALGSMMMEMVYPVLKPAFEAQIRRATVTVSWREGSAEHAFDVTQYLVAPEAEGGVDAANAGPNAPANAAAAAGASR